MGSVAYIRALSSALLNRRKLATEAGQTFEGERDLYAVLGYKLDLKPRDYRSRYKRNAIAARVVESLPKATWRGDIQVIEDENPDISTTFEEAWVEMEDRLQVWATMTRADILAGLGQYGVILIGAPGDLTSELPKTLAAERVLYLSPFSEDDVVVESIVDDTSDARFGQPDTYKFKRLSKSAIGQRQEKIVHWTRVLHIADGILDEQFLGEPRMERVWNLLDDLEKVTGGGAEAFWLRAHQGYQFDVDKDLEMDEPDYADLKTEVDEFVHGIRRFVRTRGVNLTTLGSDVAEFDNPVNAIITQIAGGTGIPKRILVGSEQAKLASTQDAANWNQRVEDRRMQYADPQIIRPFIDRLIEVKALPEPKDGYEVRWPQMTNLDEVQRAVVADKLAGVNKKIGGVIVTDAEIRDRVLQLPPIELVTDPEDLKRQEEQLEQEAQNAIAPRPIKPEDGNSVEDAE